MSKITWGDLKKSQMTWEDLKNSGLSWGDLTKDCFEIANLINSNQLIVSKEFQIKIDELCRKTIDTYNKHSKQKFILKNDHSISSKITLICTIISTLISLTSAIPTKEHTPDLNINVNIEINSNNESLKRQIDLLKDDFNKLIKELNDCNNGIRRQR